MTNRDIDKIEAWLFEQEWFAGKPVELQAWFGRPSNVLAMYYDFKDLKYGDRELDYEFKEYLKILYMAFTAGWERGQHFEKYGRMEEERRKNVYMDVYQESGKRFIPNITQEQAKYHALHGLSAEVGELHGIYQKSFQGHEMSEEHLKKETGDILWFLAEYCTAMGWKLSDVARLNLDKLDKRYPNGFEVEKSLHRNQGDI